MSLLRRSDLGRMYRRNLDLQYAGDAHSIKQQMRDNAWSIFRFHLAHNEGYRKFLDDKGFDYSDPDRIRWEDIPRITKADLKKYDPVVRSEVYSYTYSGGSNMPLRFPVSRECATSIWPNHWVMHGMCGIRPYEKMLMLMGHHAETKTFGKKVYHRLSNFHTVCSFELTDKNAEAAYRLVREKGLRFLYGYASSIYIFLRFLKKNNLHLPLKGIFSTSENVVPVCYELARTYCGCEMFDQYGAHDGDMFAFECTAHDGLHINHRYCTTEIIDGEIILTAVRNYAFPFIRYEVGDLALGNGLIEERCSCGRTLFRLRGVAGRVNHYVKDLNGKEVAVIMFAWPLDEDLSIEKYQVVEHGTDLTINIISDLHDAEYYAERHMGYIRRYLERPVRFVTNAPLVQLPNKKVPLFVRTDGTEKR